MENGLREFLIRTVMESDFRELAISEPDRAFHGFDLSEEEREVLRNGDQRMLGLLGRAFKHGWQTIVPAHGSEPAKPTTDQTAPPTDSLPDVSLRLRLTPFATETADGQPHYTYAASLHPWPTEEDSASPSSPADAAAVDLIIHISPTVIATPGLPPKVAYAAKIGLPEEIATTTPTLEARPSPTRYFGDSYAAQTAAEAVRRTAVGNRRVKLVELVQALRRGDADA